MRFDAEKAAEIIKVMRAGSGLEAAAVLAGVEPDVAKQWWWLGQEERSGPRAKFAKDVDKARARLFAGAERTVYHNAIQNKDSGDARWLLSKLAPERYGDNRTQQEAIRWVLVTVIERLRVLRADLSAGRGEAIVLIDVVIEEFLAGLPPPKKGPQESLGHRFSSLMEPEEE